MTAAALTSAATAWANALTAGSLACDVTWPNRQGTPLDATSPRLHGTAVISTDLWPDGTVVFRANGPGHVEGDGALAMPWDWRRAVRGQLRIEGRRLDAPASPLRAEIPAGHGDIGVQPSMMIFPTPGCWEVTARVGTARLTFVTLVERIGRGPMRRTSAAR